MISIHSPRMGRDCCAKCAIFPIGSISIHSPRMGRDSMDTNSAMAAQFQSTLPAWGETGRVDALPVPHFISIHSPRMGRDLNRMKDMGFNIISIHSPRMGRDAIQSPAYLDECISIHSPRMGRDGWNHRGAHDPADFNPLSPHGERHCLDGLHHSGGDFNPLSPHGERPGALPGVQDGRWISIHSPRMGRDLTDKESVAKTEISIHSPRMGRDTHPVRLLS